MKLIDAAMLASKCCASNDSVITSFKYICFDTDKILTYNGQQGMKVKTEGIEHLKCVVPGKEFIDLLRAMDESSTISVIDNVVEIKDKNTKAKLSSLKRKEFILESNDKAFENKDAVELKLSEKFFSGLDKCFSAITTNPAETNRLGITLDINSSGRISFYATDGFQLARYRYKNKNVNKEIKVLMPKDFCSLIMSNDVKSLLLNGTIKISSSLLSIEKDEVYLFSHLQSDVSFIDFEQSITNHWGNNDDSKFVEMPDELITALNRCSLILKKEDDKVLINTERNIMRITSVSDVGKVKEIIRVKGKLIDSEFLISISKMKDLLTVTKNICITETNKNFFVILGQDVGVIRLLACIPTHKIKPDDKEE